MPELSSCSSKYLGNHSCFGIWDPGLGIEMRKDWPTGCHRWNQGKDSILGKAENVLHTESHGSPGPKDLDKEAEFTRCWAKEQGLRSRDEVGNLEGQVREAEPKVFPGHWEICMVLFRGLSWFYINAVEPSS